MALSVVELILSLKVDFKTSDAFDKINTWAESATDGLIKNYLKDKSELSTETLMMLLNAIAFKGKKLMVWLGTLPIDNWAKTFMKEKTRQGEFFLHGGESVMVPMMSMEGQMVYLEGDDYRVVAKPFRVSSNIEI